MLSFDTEALLTVFTRLGFNVVVHDDLTAHKMLLVLRELGSRNFLDDDALVSSVTHLQSCNICDYCICFMFCSLKEQFDILEKDQICGLKGKFGCFEMGLYKALIHSHVLLWTGTAAI